MTPASSSRLRRNVRRDNPVNGYCHLQFLKLEAVLRRQLQQTTGGTAVCVYHRGECVVDLWGGCRDEAGRPWLENTMAPSFSTTKGVSSTLLHIYADRGLIDYDALAPQGMRNFDFGTAETLRAAIPAGNGLFTARSLARMYAMWAGDGQLDGVRLLSGNTAAQLSEPVPAPGKYAVIPFDMRWRLGFHGVYTNRGFRKQAFGHFGMGGSGAWADPDLDLSVALITNGGTGSPLGDMRIARISGAALDCAMRRRAGS